MLKHFKYKKNLKVNYDMYLLKSTLDYVKPFKLNLILIIILLFFSMIFSTIQPLLFGQIIDAIANKDFNLVIKVLLMIACLFSINLVLNIIQRYLVTITGAKIEMNVKERVLESILGLKISEFSSVQHGEFINKLENDVRAFSNILT
ncbi:ABC transporter transmembrane domain-containing protein, partial [Bacillus mobilis]